MPEEYLFTDAGSDVFFSAGGADAPDTTPLSPNSLVGHIGFKRTIVVKNVTQEEGKQIRLFSTPIDFVCIGRAGVGKTLLLEKLTGRFLGSTSRLDHGTKNLSCCEILETLEGEYPIHLRFWDTRGIDQWETNRGVDDVILEISDNQIRPLCVFYCATGNGRVATLTVTRLLQHFYDTGVPVFYVITNIYSLSSSALDEQINGGKQIMEGITDARAVEQSDLVYVFNERSFLVGVNSEVFTSRLVTAGILNIKELMQLCCSALHEEKLLQFFVATLHNRTFWESAHDFLLTVGLRVTSTTMSITKAWETLMRRIFH